MLPNKKPFSPLTESGPREADRMVLCLKTTGPPGTADICSFSLQTTWSFTETKLLACLTLSSSSMPAHLQQVVLLSYCHVTVIPNGSELLKSTLAMDWINHNLIFPSSFRPGTSLLCYSLAILLGSALLKNILVIGYLASDVCVLSCLEHNVCLYNTISALSQSFCIGKSGELTLSEHGDPKIFLLQNRCEKKMRSDPKVSGKG